MQWRLALGLLCQLDELLLEANEIVLGAATVACELATHAKQNPKVVRLRSVILTLRRPPRLAGDQHGDKI